MWPGASGASETEAARRGSDRSASRTSSQGLRRRRDRSPPARAPRQGAGRAQRGEAFFACPAASLLEDGFPHCAFNSVEQRRLLAGQVFRRDPLLREHDAILIAVGLRHHNVIDVLASVHDDGLQGDARTVLLQRREGHLPAGFRVLAGHREGGAHRPPIAAQRAAQHVVQLGHERNAVRRQPGDATALGPLYEAVAGHDGHHRKGRFGAPDQAPLHGEREGAGAFQWRAKPFQRAKLLEPAAQDLPLLQWREPFVGRRGLCIGKPQHRAQKRRQAKEHAPRIHHRSFPTLF